MNEAALRPYREYHAQRERKLREERESLRLRVLEQARRVIRLIAPDFPAIRAVHLFGSVLAPGRFHPASDIDVAVDCDNPEAEAPFARALEEILERDVDLRPRNGAVARAVEDSGERCYERQVPDPGT